MQHQAISSCGDCSQLSREARISARFTVQGSSSLNPVFPAEAQSGPPLSIGNLALAVDFISTSAITVRRGTVVPPDSHARCLCRLNAVKALCRQGL